MIHVLSLYLFPICPELLVGENAQAHSGANPPAAEPKFCDPVVAAHGPSEGAGSLPVPVKAPLFRKKCQPAFLHSNSSSRIVIQLHELLTGFFFC